MAATCPNCGNEVKEGAPYCDLCYGVLGPGGQAGPPGELGGKQLPPVSPVSFRGARVGSEAQSHPAAGVMPGSVEVPGTAPYPPPPPPGYGQPSKAVDAPPNVTGSATLPPQAYRQPAARPGVESYHRKIVISTLVLAVAGILVLSCTFMPWMGMDAGFGIKLEVSGWQIYQGAGEMGSNPFYLRLGGISIFTGMCSLVIGILMIGLAGAHLIWRRRELVYAVFPVTLIALGTSLINTLNISRMNGLSLGFGTIIFLVASIAGIAAGVFIRQNLLP